MMILLGTFLDTDLTSADSIYFISNKSNAASSVETTGSINGQAVDILETIPAAATFVVGEFNVTVHEELHFLLIKLKKHIIPQPQKITPCIYGSFKNRVR